jgi:hypothetical protein
MKYFFLILALAAAAWMGYGFATNLQSTLKSIVYGIPAVLALFFAIILLLDPEVLKMKAKAAPANTNTGREAQPKQTPRPVEEGDFLAGYITRN